MSAQVELKDLLAGFAAARETASTDDGAARIPALATRVRGRRVVRAAAASGAAAAAVLGLGAAVYGLTRPDHVPPVELPTPVVTPTPSPTPTDDDPAEEPTPDALGPVTDHPLLPDAEPLRTGAIEGTGPGWSLVTYYDADLTLGAEPDHPTVLYLLAPDGRPAEVPTPVPLMAECTFCGDGSFVPAVHEWLPGTALAIVAPVHDDPESILHWQVVDLVSGQVLQAIEAEPGGWVGVRFVGDGTTDVVVVHERVAIERSAAGVTRVERRRADGALVAEHGAYDTGYAFAWSVSPGGAYVALHGDGEGLVLRSADLDEVARPTADDAPCPQGDAGGRALSPAGWSDESTLLFTCVAFSSTGTSRTTALAVPLDGDPRELGRDLVEDVAGAFDGRLLLHDWASGAWATLGADGSRTDVLVRARSLDPGARPVAGRLVHADDEHGPDGAEPTWAVSSTDLADGGVETLLAPVDAGSRLHLVVGR